MTYVHASKQCSEDKPGHSCKNASDTGLPASLPNLAKALLDCSKSQCFLLVVCQAFHSHSTRVLAVPLASHVEFATTLVKRLLPSTYGGVEAPETGAETTTARRVTRSCGQWDTGEHPRLGSTREGRSQQRLSRQRDDNGTRVAPKPLLLHYSKGNCNLCGCHSDLPQA